VTTTIVYAAAADGYLRCADPVWANVVAGTGTITSDDADSSVYWGQSGAGATFYAWEAFHTFTYSPDATERITAAYFQLRSVGNDTTAVSRTLDVAEYDWGGTIGTGDWRTAAQLAAATPLTAVLDAQAAGTLRIRQGSDALVTRLAAASPLRTVSYSNRYAGGVTPTSSEMSWYRSADQSGTSDDPAVVYTSVPLSTHLPCAGAQVQLSDGAWAYLESSGAATPTVTLKRTTTGGVTTTIATVPTGTSSTDFAVAAPRGQLGIALVVDSSDNLYVLGAQGSNTGAIAARAYIKGAGTTWTAGTLRASALPAYPGAGINAVAGAWHNTGTGGTILAVACRGVGWWASAPTMDAQYALLDCQHLLTGGGSGGLLRNSGTAVGVLVRSATSGEFTAPANETGSGLDVVAAPDDTTRGYVVSFARAATLGSNYPVSLYRYTLASGGASIAATLDLVAGLWGVKDAAAKARVLTPGSGVVIAATADSDTLWGLTVTVTQNIATSSTYTDLAYVTLDDQGITSMPSAASIAAAAAWDAHYDPTDHKVWLYYIDTADARRVMRTAVDLHTYLATREEVEVAADVGGVGTTVTSVRVARGYASGDTVLVHLALDTAGVQSSQVVVDSLNKAPTQPTLTPRANFDAAAETVAFTWTFNDPNSTDAQSAFELQIIDSSGATALDTGKGAAAAYVSRGTGAVGNNASLVPGAPTGVAEDDLVVIFASIRNSGTGTVDTPAGWTSLAESGNCKILGRIWQSADTMPTVTFTGGAANATTLAQAIALRNTHQTIADVVHASATQLNASAQDIATPALTVSEPGCIVIWYGWKQDDWTSSAGPSGSTNSAVQVSTTGDDAGDDAGHVAAHVVQTTAADVAASGWTLTGGAAAISRGIMLAIRPLAAPTVEEYTLVAGTVANADTYQWRVRTYDGDDEVSPWSDYGVFSTSAGGNVTVTDPTADNPDGVVTDDYTIEWSVSGTTQASYRVVVTRTDTSAELVNTGWVTGTGTTYTVTGMTSDVEYQIAVTVRNASLVESGTGTRLITASYAAPETPTIAVSAVDDDGYVLVAVTNPDSGTGDLGTSPYGFESGVSEMTAAGCTVTQSSEQAYEGTYSAKVEVVGSPSIAYIRPTYATQKVAVEAGQRYTVSYWAYSPAGYASVQNAINWYDSSDVNLSSSWTTSAVAAGAWTYRTHSAEAPAGAAWAIYGPSLSSSPTAGEVLYVDELLLAVTSDRPVPTGNEIHRRRADGSGDTVVIAEETEVAVDGTWRDYRAASGVAYEYRARAVASTGHADSDWVAATPALQGVWLHDPTDPQGSVLHLPYGRSARSSTVEVDQTGLVFAGRVWPVVEHGESQTDTHTVKAIVPHGPTWAGDVAALQDLVESRRTLYLRDNRGRSAWCVLSGFQAVDVDEGTEVSFAAARVDWTETTL
jgi:hypothetical protein